MKSPTDWSLSFRLIIFIGFSVLLVTTITTFYTYQISSKHIIEETRLRATETVNKTVNLFLQKLNGVQKSTDLLASVVGGFEGEEEGLRELLKNTVSTNSSIFGGTIALAKDWSQGNGFAPYYYGNNEKLVYADLTQGKYNYTQQAWFKGAEIAEKPLWSEPYFDEDGGQILMTTYSVPVYRSQMIDGLVQKSLYAVVTGDVSLNLIQEMLQSIKLGDTGHVLLLGKRGQLLSYPDESSIMKPLLGLLPTQTSDSRWFQAIDDMLAGGHGIRLLPCLDGDDRYDSEDMCFLAYDPLPFTHWPLAVIIPEDEVLAELHAFTLQFTVISIVVLLLLLFLIGVITSKLTRPLFDLVEASSRFGQGKFDVILPEIKRNDEVGKLVKAFTKMQQELKRYIKQLETETANRHRLEGELSAAHQIQMSMLPGNGKIHFCHPLFNLWAGLIPAKSVGGDLYQFHLQQGSKLVFIVGDVSDKGVAAALFMARTVSLLKQQFNSDQGPDLIMYHINNALEENNDACMFVTLFYAELDLITGTLVYASAGHHSPMVMRSGLVEELEQQGAAALGLMDDVNYPLNHTQLQRGDKLFLYTDGVDEAFNDQQEMYGHERLNTFLEKSQFETVDIIGSECFTGVQQFAGDFEQSDDITVMVLDFQPDFTFLIEKDRVSTAEIFSLSPELAEIEHVFANIVDFSQKKQLSEECIGVVKLVAEEILVNAIQYGCAKSNEDLYYVLCDTESGILMEFIDAGVVYNPLVEAPAPQAEVEDDIQIGGLGVYFVKTMTTQQMYQRKGHYNHLCVYLENT